MNMRACWNGLSECVLLPLLAILLPWRVFWRMARRLAVHDLLFRDETAHALNAAMAQGHAAEAGDWRNRQRLVRIVDLADAALSGTRGDGWMSRRIIVDGDRPPEGPCLFLGFHYGTGFWVLRYLRSLGQRVSFLSRRILREDFPGMPLCYAFERWRMHLVSHAGGGPVIYVGGSVAKMKSVLQDGGSILAMADVPLEHGAAGRTVPFLDGKAQLPDGLIRLAESEKVPIVAYLCRLDTGTGQRRLSFARLPDEVEDKLAWLMDLLGQAIREDPAAWHLWAEWPRFFPGSKV